MTTWRAFQQIAIHSLDLAVYAWPISVAVIVAALLALATRLPLRNRTFWKVLLIAYAMPVAVMVVGAVLRYDVPRELGYVEPAFWRAAVLYGVLAVNVVALVAAVVLMRGARFRAAALVLPSIWLTLSSGFIAAIAIAGVGP